MSDTPTDGTGTPAAAPDPYKNLKAEMDRKITSQEQSIAKLLESQQQLMAQLQKQSAPAVKDESEELNDLWYSKPEVAANKIKEKAKAEIREELAQQNAATNQRNSVLSQLITDYPELNNQSSDLTKKAVEYYNALPEDEKSRPMAYRLAVKEAAADLGVKPASKREDYNDAYVTGSSGGSTGGTKRQRDDEIDANTAALAKIMGVDVNKVKDRAKSRKSWNRYE